MDDLRGETGGIPAGEMSGHGLGETILFVDDEVYLAEVGKEMLEDYGYHVEAMTISMDALEAFVQTPDKFDLVITDYTMPGMMGDLLAEKIQKIRPGIPIIMCTGIPLDPEITKGLRLEKILLKPLDMEGFLQLVRTVLDHPLSRQPGVPADKGSNPLDGLPGL
ncbi:MAG: response regulator [Desulfobacteraceae bacterium]|nr:response regulator [Desulfobacteraceae bacterium]